jgi:hypothetical protein
MADADAEPEKKLENAVRITGRTAYLVRDEFARRVGEIERGYRLQFRGRKAKLEAILSAVILDFLAKPTEEQDEIVRRCLPVYEHIVAVQFGERPDPGDLIAAARPGATKAPAEKSAPKRK